MITKTSPKAGRVLQGYFRIEQFRGIGRTGAVAHPMASGWRAPATAPPRSERLPVQMRGMVGQPKPAPGLAWRGAPRPDLLPGMGPAIVGGLRMVRMVAQARPGMNHEVVATPVSAGQLRMIGEGRPLEPGIRRTMEALFQTDFSTVRVHQGPTALAMGALAFTLGEELHFAPGRYDPKTRAGLALLGHELAHVVQQREGRVGNPYGQAVAIVQDPELELEAERMGQRVADEVGLGGGMVRWAGAHASGRDAVQLAAAPKKVERKAAAAAAPKHEVKRASPAAAAPAAAPATGGAAAASAYANLSQDQEGQIYGIWENEQYPLAIELSSLSPGKCLYIGKTARGEEALGARFVEHTRIDEWAPWCIQDGTTYGDKHMQWPYVVRNVSIFKELTRMDVAVAEQYYMQRVLEQGAKLLNRINAITLAKFNEYKDRGAWTTATKYPGWKPINITKQ